MTASPCRHGVVGIGVNTFRTLREALLQDLGEEAGSVRLQEAGFAAGRQVYDSFLEWLPAFSEVRDPAELDAAALGEVLSAYFAALGWGAVEVTADGRGLSVRCRDWAESDPAAGASVPRCYVSTGLLASFFTQLAGERTLGVMEVACRTQGDEYCEFLVGAPAVLDAVYLAVAEGRDAHEVLTA
jgi:predicted hydrocarbon binding protein